MKNLICYKSKNGATEEYMNLLKSEISSDMKSFDEVSRKDDFSDYKTIIVSSGTYAGLMPLTRFLKKYWKKLQDKNIVVVAVGAAPADDKWSSWSYNRIPQKIREKIQYFKILGETPEKTRPKGYKSPVNIENLKEVIKTINS